MSQSSKTGSKGARFRVAQTAEDYALCDRLAQKESVLRSLIDFPTVMALDEDDNLAGFIGTKIEKQMIIAGPLVMRSDKRRVFQALRLCDAYRLVMQSLGIKSFIFYGPVGGLMDNLIKRYYPSLHPYAIADGNAFYIWRSSNGRGSEGSTADSGGASPSAIAS